MPPATKKAPAKRPRKTPAKRAKQAPFPEDLKEDMGDLLEALHYEWSIQARAEQNPNDFDEWVYWLFLAGRGTGKTRAGAERVRHWAESGRFKLMHLIAPTAADVRDTMVEGPAGILAVSPPWFYPTYAPSKRLLTWPNGAQALLFSADEPDRLRGPQCEAMWLDEICAWRYMQETWDMAQMGFRLGLAPKCIITSTPKPVKLIKELVGGKIGRTIVTRGVTYDNRENLAEAFFDIVIKKYEGTRLGRQEINAEILDDNPNALWARKDIDDYRVTRAPELDVIVVAIDPSVSDRDDAAEVGIVAAGMSFESDPPEYYVLEDASVEGCSPLTWARAACVCYYKTEADEMIGEKNNGGLMVSTTINTVDKEIPIELVHASRGKRTRAEPISSLYEQGRVHHVGMFGELEDQMCEWEPSQESPDRMDALVWALTHLGMRDETFAATSI